MKKTKNGMICKRIVLLFVCVGSIASLIYFNAGCCGKNAEKPKNPKLVVMVVIDQLRADMISQMESRFGKGGFRYLLEKGVWYKNARYDYVTTITSVGHASLFTGAEPSGHGIIGNGWYDRKAGKKVSSTQAPDPNDPNRMMTGPYQLTSGTIGDELALAYNRKSRVYGVSLKDRGAILPAGFLGKAFWYDIETGGFRSSEYYYKNNESPRWLATWNNLKKADQYHNTPWKLLNDPATYIFGERDDQLEEKLLKVNPQLYGRSIFPRSLVSYKDKEYYDKLTVTPFADELTVDFACHVLKEEKLGQGKNMDMLTVSLSAADIIGHIYGPNCLEYEDNILRVDKALEKLFTAIDKAVGLKNTLIVLAGDHGVDYIPEYRNILGMPGGRFESKAFAEVINEALQKKYKMANPENLVIGFWNPSIYLDVDRIEKLNLNIEEVEKEAAEAVMKMKGIAIAVTRTEMLKGSVQDTPLLKKLKVVFHPGRSGNISVIQEPYWYLYPSNEDAAMHGSPYHYDAHVPVFIAGMGIKGKAVYRLVSPLDIAVTVALKIGIEAPPAASGNSLTEVFD